MKTIYEKIKQYRLENKWTQTELAHMVGYSDKSMIAKIEAGKVDLSQSKIACFCEVFGVSPIELMGMEDFIDAYIHDSKSYIFDINGKIHAAEDFKIEVEPEDMQRYSRAMAYYTKYMKVSPDVRQVVDRILESAPPMQQDQD